MFEAPAVEQLYGKLGTPPKEQGHPVLREYGPEPEDPNIPPYLDQIVDIDRRVRVDYTARLSGSFVKFLTCEYRSVVKMDAHPLTADGATIALCPPIHRSLTAGANSPNVWYWKDATKDELIFTAQTTFNPREVRLNAGHMYKLLIRWEFYDKQGARMPISGFNEAITFEVSKATVDV